MTARARSVSRWGVFEHALEGPSSGNPFVEVELQAVVTHRSGAARRVDGFYDGDGVYRFRFMPDREGEWRFVTSSNRRALRGHEGSFRVVRAERGNHGPVRVADTHHFRYADGGRYSCVGTTAYAWALQTHELIEQTLETLAAGPFDKLRMCLFPTHYGKWNAPEPTSYPFPVLRRPPDRLLPTDEAIDHWRWDFDRFDVAHFQRVDRLVGKLGRLGVEADVILFHPYDRWGFAQMSAAQDERYLRYVIARLAAHRNVWWALANEFDLFEPQKPWTKLGRLVRRRDPYGHLRSIHNWGDPYDQHETWITHASLQLFDQPRWQELRSWREEWRKPVVVDENRYEGDAPADWGSLPAEELVQRFWIATVAGAYNGHSETYVRPDDLMWWSHGGTLHGETAPRLRFLRAIVEAGPDEGLTPLFRHTSPWTAAKGEDYVIAYFGIHRPSGWTARLPFGRRYRLSLVDTWGMTTRRLPGTWVAGDAIDLPAVPYLAIVANAVSTDLA